MTGSLVSEPAALPTEPQHYCPAYYSFCLINAFELFVSVCLSEKFATEKWTANLAPTTKSFAGVEPWRPLIGQEVKYRIDYNDQCDQIWRNFQHFKRLWQLFESLLNVWQNVEPSLDMFQCYWAPFYFYKWANIKKYIAIWSHLRFYEPL